MWDQNTEDMVVKESVPKGSVIHTEKPFVYVLSSKVKHENCDYCFKQGELLKCSGCKYVSYCNRVCQKEAWSIHKLECKLLKKLTPRILPDAARFLFRLIKTLQSGGDTIKSYYTTRSYRTYKDLMSHYPNIKNDKRRLEHLDSLYGVLRDFMGTDYVPNISELTGMYGRMCINTFNICNQELQTLGTGMYLASSIIDHSCKPNAIAVFEGTTLSIRTLEDLPCLNWSKIFISYIDILATTSERQESLMSSYYFLCNCEKCLELEDFREICGAICPNAGCENSLVINDDRKVSSVCSKCNNKVPKEFEEQYKDVVEFTTMHLGQMKHVNYLDVCKVCLKRQNNVFNNSHILRVKTLDHAFESCIHFQLFNDALDYGSELIKYYYKYYGKTHPLTGLLHLKLGKILIYKDNIKDGAYHVKKSHEILKITHGVNSSLYKRDIIPLWQQCK